FIWRHRNYRLRVKEDLENIAVPQFSKIFVVFRSNPLILSGKEDVYAGIGIANFKFTRVVFTTFVQLDHGLPVYGLPHRMTTRSDNCEIFGFRHTQYIGLIRRSVEVIYGACIPNQGSVYRQR